MWYFSWILGLGLALCFGVLNAIWYEILESQREAAARLSGRDQHPDRGAGHQQHGDPAEHQ